MVFEIIPQLIIDLKNSNFHIYYRYYGLWLWFPELFNKLNEYYKVYPDDSKTVCEILNFEPPENNSVIVVPDDEFCKNPVPDSEVFINSLYISLAAAPGNLWSIVHMDKLGRKFFFGKYFSPVLTK